MTAAERSGPMTRRTKQFVQRRLWSMFEPGSRFERRLGALRRPDPLRRERHDGFTISSAARLLVVEPDHPTRPDSVIQMFGGCDLPTMLAIGPIIGPELTRRVVIQHNSALAASRADIMVQSLDPPTGPAVRDTISRMNLPATYFQPLAFEPTICVREGKLGTLEKTVVVLTGGASAIRPAYRHKTEGFLVDPGGWWLRNRTKLSNEDLTWFRSNFETAGRLPVERFVEDFARLVREMKARTRAEVVVFNTLTVEPGTREHNYQLRRSPDGVRRIEFHIALSELAPVAGFRIIDIDDVLKRTGVKEQVDFNHFARSSYEPIASEAAAVLREIGAL